MLTEAEVGKVLDEDVGRVLGPHGARLEEGEPGLHHDDQRAHQAEEEVVHVGRQRRDHGLQVPVGVGRLGGEDLGGAVHGGGRVCWGVVHPGGILSTGDAAVTLNCIGDNLTVHAFTHVACLSQWLFVDIYLNFAYYFPLRLRVRYSIHYINQ